MIKTTKTIKNYFTIVELLLVIVIIAILSALLLPSLSQSKSKAAGISCTSQLKQIGMAYNQYLIETNYTVPVYIQGKRWFDYLANFIDGVKEDKKNLSNILSCPLDFRKESNKFLSNTNSPLSYGINQCYTPAYSNNKEYKLWYSVNANRIANFSKFISIADSVSYYIGTTIEPNVYGTTHDEFSVVSGWCKGLSFRHGNEKAFNFNAAFADGHCESLIFNNSCEKLFDLRNLGNYTN